MCSTNILDWLKHSGGGHPVDGSGGLVTNRWRMDMQVEQTGRLVGMVESPEGCPSEGWMRKALHEAQAESGFLQRSEETRQHRWDQQRGRSESRGKASYQRSVSRERGHRSSSRSKSRDGFGRDNSRRSALAKWFSCFKTPRAALSHPPEQKNTSCTTKNGESARWSQHVGVVANFYRDCRII